MRRVRGHLPAELHHDDREDPGRCRGGRGPRALHPVRSVRGGLSRPPDAGARGGPVRRAYAGYCLDPELRDRGASGGIVPLIAARLYDQGYAVYGAAFTGDRRLKHICAETPEDLRRIAKSKYLQSGLDGGLHGDPEKARGGPVRSLYRNALPEQRPAELRPRPASGGPGAGGLLLPWSPEPAVLR